MFIGKEQRYHPAYSQGEKYYIHCFGVPIVGSRIRTRNILSLIPQRSYRRILDAGSGSGVITFAMAERFQDAVVIGLDEDKQAIGAAKIISRKAKVNNVFFRSGGIEKLAVDRAFDLVVCVDILEHIKEDQIAIDALYNATSHGGTLVLHVPSYYRRYPVFKRRVNFQVPTHVRPGYALADIKEKVIRAGFSIDACGYTYGFWETLANNISYKVTKAEKRNKHVYAMIFPVLMLMAWIGKNARPESLGAGVYVIGSKHSGFAEATSQAARSSGFR